MMASPPPLSLNRRHAASVALARMYLNDNLGCCVISASAHSSACSPGQKAASTSKPPTTRSCSSTAFWNPGTQDNGAVITDVLNYCGQTGFLMAGNRYKLDGYCAVDWTNELETQVALTVFGATSIGLDLPEAYLSADVWDVTDSPTVGGHNVLPIDFGPEGIYLSSWGRIYLMTWPAFMSRNWISESYALLAPLWYAKGGVSVYGINAAVLLGDMKAFMAGDVPDPGPGPSPTPPSPPPTPTPPPVPPTPPAPTPPPPAPASLFTMTFGRDFRRGEPISFNLPVDVPRGTDAVVPVTPHKAVGLAWAEVVAAVAKYGPIVWTLIQKYGPGIIQSIADIEKQFGGGGAAKALADVDGYGNPVNPMPGPFRVTAPDGPPDVVVGGAPAAPDLAFQVGTLNTVLAQA